MKKVYVLMHQSATDKSTTIEAISEDKKNLFKAFKKYFYDNFILAGEGDKELVDGRCQMFEMYEKEGRDIGEDECWWIEEHEMVNSKKIITFGETSLEEKTKEPSLEKITFEELRHIMMEHNDKTPKDKLSAVIVFAEDTFDQKYSLNARSYRVTNDNKGFRHSFSNSIRGDCLDSSEEGVRLDWHLPLYAEGNEGWKVDYCYIEKCHTNQKE